MTPPLPDPGASWALFLDLDGTLAEIAPHPGDVHLPQALVAMLSRLEDRLDGALAIVSGRSIADLDGLLAPMAPRAAGLHGVQRRNGESQTTGAPTGVLADASRDLEQFVARHPGLMLEDKGTALALHYRNAPALESACRDRSHAVVNAVPDHHVIAGKMVFEIKPRHTHKGAAIAAFLREAPFRGRTLVFAGDDVTDEDGFREVNAVGGISVKIGDGPSEARFRLPGVASLHDWLARVEQRLTPPRADAG